MPVRAIPHSAEKYYLLIFDKHGREIEERRQLLSEQVASDHPDATDVFVFMHGWMGDVPAAIDQYDRWIGAMASLPADRTRMEASRPGGFRPAWLGLHWPSLPWGDEDPGAMLSFAIGALDALVESYVERLGGDYALRDLLRCIIGHTQQDARPPVMPDEVAAAYREVNAIVGLPADGVTGSPEGDRLAFDPAAEYTAAQLADGVDFGGSGLAGTLLSPLRTLSFWTMKRRARIVGESGFHTLLVALSSRLGGARFHLMGHSFGCIAASAAICGPKGSDPFTASSLALVQGALSLWSFSADMPPRPGSPGYFSRLLGEGRVTGPIVTTRSRFDRAVGSLYPLAAGVAGQVDYGARDTLPTFGGVGAFGAQGLGAGTCDMAMLAADADYTMIAGRVHNLEASAFIRRGGGLSGAHSDISGPEVAHAVWSASIAA